MSFDSLYLYNLTLQRPASSLMTVVGQFQGNKSQEIVIAKTTCLDLYKVDSTSGKMIKMFTQDSFGSIRSVCGFRLAGGLKDYLAVTSDSGKFTILSLNPDKKRFEVVFNEPFSKSGLRRLVPGEYLVNDAKGRAVMLTAIEKNKLVYVLNRDQQDKLTISSPLEANRNKILTFACCGLDVGYENPLFASIEIDYGELEDHKKTLTYYELALGLNHIVKKYSETISETSNFLLSIPGGSDGPSGVIVGCKDFIQYMNQGVVHILPIPKRVGSKADNYIITGAVHKIKIENRKSFFILLQSNHGDLFKVTIDFILAKVKSMSIKYFDTLPVCNSLIILKSGLIFADSQIGDKSLYQIINLADDDKQPEYNSQDYFNTSEEVDDVTFAVKPIENLELYDTIQGINPIIDATLIDNQIYSICGTGSQSCLNTLHHGLTVNEEVTSELPNNATGVFTTKIDSKDQYDRYLVISFASSTLVLSIGESVEEVSDSGFETESATIGVQQMGVSSLVQIHSNGIIHLTGKEKQNQWFPPAGIKIVCCTSTNYQLAIGLSNKELVYFEFSDEEKLMVHSEPTVLPDQILSLTLGDIPEGKLRSSFLAVSCGNQTIQVLSVDPANLLSLVSIQELSSNATAVLLMLMTEQDRVHLNLHIGLESGIYVKALLNSSGQVSDKVVQYLGPHPISLTRLEIDNHEAVMILSSKTYLARNSNSGFTILPLAYNVTLTRGASFNSEDCPHGLVGVSANNLMILTLENLTNEFKIDSLALQHTPKRFIQHDSKFYIIESQVNSSVWSSSIQVIEDGEVLQSLNLDHCFYSICKCYFQSKNRTYIVIGGKVANKSFLWCYNPDLSLVHQTAVESPVISCVEFAGKLLAGVGGALRLYDVGQKQLLRKAEVILSGLTNIVRLKTQGLRVVVADVKESITFVVFKEAENKFIPFADDIIARHVTSFEMVDYNTVIGGDKFGNFWVLRCPDQPSKISDEDKSGVYISSQDSLLGGTPYKLNLLAHYFLNDIPTSFNKVADLSGLNNSIIYTGLQGTIGLLTPLLTKSEIKFFQELQKNLALEELLILGRDHMMYRSYYVPIKAVIDGDLCEKYLTLNESTKSQLALKMNRSVREIERKIIDLRLKVSY